MKVRNSLISLALLLGSVYAGATAVTATITDGTNTWANCKFSVRLINSRPDITPNVNGTNLTAGQISQTGSCNGSGVLAVTLVDSTTISPVGTTWQFTITPNASSQSGVGTTAVSGSSQSLSVFLSSIVPVVSFPAGPSSYGYADANVSGTVLPGQTYYNVTTPAFRQWSGSAWATVGGGGGTGNTTCATTTNLLQGNGVAGGCVASVISDDATNYNITGRGLIVSGALETNSQFFVISASSAHILLDGGTQNGIQFNSASGSDRFLEFTGSSGFAIYDLDASLRFSIDNNGNVGTPSGVFPSISAAATVAQVVCVKAAGPPLVVGVCSTVVGAGGACTCN